MKEIVADLWEIDEIGDRVHAYLWRRSDGLTLIDTGFPGDGPTILAALQRAGFDPQQVDRILITHADIDHLGSLRFLAQRLPVTVVCHSVERGWMEFPRRRTTAPTLAGALMRPIYALVTLLPAYKMEGVVPGELVVDGQELPEGFTVIHTPGHTPGHISFLHRERRLLIVGDALANWGGKLGGPAVLFTPDAENAQRTIWKLAKRYGKEYDTVVFGHGPPILENGGAAVQAHAAQIFGEAP